MITKSGSGQQRLTLRQLFGVFPQYPVGDESSQSPNTV
jgi:hypothetical protein